MLTILLMYWQYSEGDDCKKKRTTHTHRINGGGVATASRDDNNEHDDHHDNMAFMRIIMLKIMMIGTEEMMIAVVVGVVVVVVVITIRMMPYDVMWHAKIIITILTNRTFSIWSNWEHNTFTLVSPIKLRNNIFLAIYWKLNNRMWFDYGIILPIRVFYMTRNHFQYAEWYGCL